MGCFHRLRTECHFATNYLGQSRQADTLLSNEWWSKVSAELLLSPYSHPYNETGVDSCDKWEVVTHLPLSNFAILRSLTGLGRQLLINVSCYMSSPQKHSNNTHTYPGMRLRELPVIIYSRQYLLDVIDATVG